MKSCLWSSLQGSFFVSKYHIAHIFKEQMGLSVHQYILKKRMQASKAAILGETSITDVYTMFGFKDYSRFLPGVSKRSSGCRRRNIKRYMESCKKVDGNRYLLSEEETAIMCISNEQCRHVRNSIWLFTGRMLFLAGWEGECPTCTAGEKHVDQNSPERKYTDESGRKTRETKKRIHRVRS